MKLQPEPKHNLAGPVRAYWASVAFLVSIVPLAGCASRGNSQPSTPVEESVTVTVAEATRQDLTGDVVLTAEFRPYQEVDVMAKVAGYVQTINVDIGDRVHTGQLLATLEVPEMSNDLAKAAASLQQANAAVLTAQRELQRAKSSHDIAHLHYTRIADVAKREPGLVPQQEIDDIHSRDLVAEAQEAAAQAELEGAEQHVAVAKAEQARIKTLSNYTLITAPFDGVVTKRYANTGSMIQAGISSQTQAMPLVRLSQNSVLRLILPVPESRVSDVKIGRPVSVRLLSSGRTLTGRVARFADSIHMSTRTMDTEVDVANPRLTLVPGMYAEVTLTTTQHVDATVIPLEAIDESTETTRVYSVDRAGTIHLHPVQVGLRTPQMVEVVSGLHPGDKVVVGRHTGLHDGQKVVVKQISSEGASPAQES